MRITCLLASIALFTACTDPEPMEVPVDAAPTPDGPSATTNGVQVIDLGVVASEVPIEFAVPANTLGFHVVVEAATDTEQVGIANLTSPSGKVTIDEFFPIGSRAPAAGQWGIAAASVPQTSFTAARPVEHGMWTVAFFMASGQPGRAKVYVRTTEDGAFHGGALDLRVYIPDGLMISDPTPVHAVTAATAATDPAIAARIDSFYTTLDALFELDRGTVEYVALPSTYASIGDIMARDRALKLTSTPGDTPVVHLILVNNLVVYDTKIWGISAGVPGTATRAGHPMAGVVVDISLGFPAAADGMTMLHELGHFLGLFHTTEQDLVTHDPIDDTPECAVASAPCAGRSNIMYSTFYGATGGVGLTASEQQRRVVWGSPLYRHAE